MNQASRHRQASRPDVRKVAAPCTARPELRASAQGFVGAVARSGSFLTLPPAAWRSGERARVSFLRRTLTSPVIAVVDQMLSGR
jgi:hypothetical protein